VLPTTAAQTEKTGYNGSGSQAGLYGPDTDYTYALDRVPFTQVNAWVGGNAAGTKATNLSSARQPAPWLNTPQYGDDGLLLSGSLAQTGKTGYDGSAAQDELYQPDRTSFTSVNFPNLAEDIQAEYGRRLTRSLTDGAYQAQQDLAALRGGTTSQFSDTRYLTAPERSVILAYADRGEYAAAMSYYDSLKDSLAQRTGRQIADSIGSMEDPVLKDLIAVGLGLDDGLNRSVGGLVQAGSRLLGSDAPVAQSPSVYANRIIRPQLTGIAGAASDVASSVGFMLPGFALGAATGLPALGSVMLGLTSAGDTYNRERNAGKDDMEAFFYAASIGALEGSLQYMLGGISALGKNGVSKLLAETPAAQAAVTKVDDALRLVARSETAQDLRAAAGEAGGFALRMNDQGLEEWLQANLEPVIRNVVFGEDNQFQPFSSDKLYSYMLGALTAGLYNLYYDNLIERGSMESTKAQFEKDFEEGWAEGGDQGIASPEDTGEAYDPYNALALSTRFVNKMDPMWKNSEKIQPIDGYQDIVCHGDRTGFSYLDLDGNEINLSPREFAEILKNSPVFEGRPVRLISCQAGAEGSINAQYMANQLNVPVLAPTDIVYVYPDGVMIVGKYNTGRWKLFHPKER
jgi:hypothetical protein